MKELVMFLAVESPRYLCFVTGLCFIGFLGSLVVMESLVINLFNKKGDK